MTQLQSVSSEGQQKLKCLNFFVCLFVKTNKLTKKTIDPKDLMWFCFADGRNSARYCGSIQTLDMQTLIRLEENSPPPLAINHSNCAVFFPHIGSVSSRFKLHKISSVKSSVFFLVFLSILYLKRFWTWLTDICGDETLFCKPNLGSFQIARLKIRILIISLSSCYTK